MKALRISRTGDLKYLELLEVPVPEPADGEVLVRIRAAGLNQSDVSNVLGKHPYTTLPRTPGRDFSGVVIAGPADRDGQEVWGTGKELGFTRDGTHAECLVLPGEAVAAKPKSLSFAQAAACGVPYTTAWSALERCGVAKGTRLLVVGAAGAVGSAALELARWRGAQIAAVVRRPEQASALEARGIVSILLEGGRALGESAAKIFPGGAEVVFDTTGHWLPGSISALAPYGRVAVIVAPAEGDVSVPVRDLYRRAASIVGINSLMLGTAECARILERIGEGFDTGQLQAPGGLQERPLETAVAVYGDVNRKARGKFVFVAS